MSNQAEAATGTTRRAQFWEFVTSFLLKRPAFSGAVAVGVTAFASVWMLAGGSSTSSEHAYEEEAFADFDDLDFGTLTKPAPVVEEAPAEEPMEFNEPFAFGGAPAYNDQLQPAARLYPTDSPELMRPLTTTARPAVQTANFEANRRLRQPTGAWLTGTIEEIPPAPAQTSPMQTTVRPMLLAPGINQ